MSASLNQSFWHHPRVAPAPTLLPKLFAPSPPRRLGHSAETPWKLPSSPSVGSIPLGSQATSKLLLSSPWASPVSCLRPKSTDDSVSPPKGRIRALALLCLHPSGSSSSSVPTKVHSQLPRPLLRLSPKSDDTSGRSPHHWLPWPTPSAPASVASQRNSVESPSASALGLFPSARHMFRMAMCVLGPKALLLCMKLGTAPDRCPTPPRPRTVLPWP